MRSDCECHSSSDMPTPKKQNTPKKAKTPQKKDSSESSASDDEFGVNIVTDTGTHQDTLQAIHNSSDSEEAPQSDSESSDLDESDVVEDDEGVMAAQVAENFLDLIPKLANNDKELLDRNHKYFPDGETSVVGPITNFGRDEARPEAQCSPCQESHLQGFGA